VWTSVSAMALAVFAITGSLTFGAGLTNILDTPRIAGVNWDAFFFHPIRSAADPTLIDRANLEEALADQPDITGFTAGTWWPVFPQGAPMELGPQRLAVAYLSFDAPSAIGPSVIRGRTPQTADEVLVGPETLDDLGLELGDTVEVHGQAGTWDEPGAETSLRARIVGVGVVPIVGGEARLGRGVTLTIDGLRRLNPETQPDGYWLRLAAGSDAATVVTEVLQAVKASRSFEGPAYFDQSMLIGMTSVQNIAQVARAPQLFAAVMGVLGLGVILHILANGLRAHRRDLAVLRALGFRRRDVDHAVAWQSIVYMFTALAVGVPLGVVVGRFALRLYAERLGVVPEPVIPWAQLGLLSAVAVAIAGTMGMALSRATSSANPAVALRAE